MLRILRESVDRLGQTVVIVTHDPHAAGYADRVLFLADGRIVDELRAPTADTVLDKMKQLETAHERSRDAVAMRKVSLRNLRAHKVRLLLTLISVLLGTAFVAGSFVFTDTLKQSFDTIFATSDKGIDTRVQPTQGLRRRRARSRWSTGSAPSPGVAGRAAADRRRRSRWSTRTARRSTPAARPSEGGAWQSTSRRCRTRRSWCTAARRPRSGEVVVNDSARRASTTCTSATT